MKNNSQQIELTTSLPFTLKTADSADNNTAWMGFSLFLWQRTCINNWYIKSKKPLVIWSQAAPSYLHHLLQTTASIRQSSQT